MYLIIIGLYLSFVGLIIYGLHRLLGMGVIGGIVVGILLILAPSWDVFVTKGIMMSFNRQHAPLQEIIRTVEKPDSVLWLDDVWPGFDEYGRHWMVESYLDGVHLKSLALNGNDGRIYLYRASIVDFAGSERIRPEFEKLEKKLSVLEKEANEIWKKRTKGAKWPWPEIREKYEKDTKELQDERKLNGSKLKSLNYKKLREQEIDKIFASPKIYTSPEDLPPANYLIHLQPVHLPDWQKKFVWCDEIVIQDNQRNRRVAFSKRCLGYNPFASVNYRGKGSPFFGGARLGDKRTYEFDDKVLFEYAKVRGGLDRLKNTLRKSSYRSGAIDWKSVRLKKGE